MALEPGPVQMPEGLFEEADLDVWNPQASRLIRQHAIHSQLQQRENEYTELHNLQVYTSTWNVNGKYPDENLDSWLLPNSPDESMADIYAIGFQEMVDLNAANVVVDSSSSRRANEWQNRLLSVLNHGMQKEMGVSNNLDDNQYVTICSKYLVGIFLVVYMKRKHAKHVKRVQGQVAGVGIMGMMGNKGGAAIRFQLFDSTLCFVCSHLAAHRNNVAGRNSDFAAIVNKIRFQEETIIAATQNALSKDETLPQGLGTTGIFDHDIVLWLGDLNYRIRSELALQSVMELSKRAEHGEEDALRQLRQHDQLNIERAKKHTFHGFTESELTFAPTYKYQPGTSRYEQRPDKKQRAPAWCDRILWRCAFGHSSQLRQKTYARSELITSDHKPVYSVFEVDVRIVDDKKRREVFTDVLHRIDAAENASMPSVSLSTHSLDFGDVALGLPVSQVITMKNIGNVAAAWLFVPKPEDMWFAAPWFSIRPAFGILEPDQSVDIRISIRYSVAVARDVSYGRINSLDDILILRLKRGRDFFVSIKANPLPSCFGCTLEQLARRKESVRSLGLGALVASLAPEERPMTISEARRATLSSRRSSVGSIESNVVPTEDLLGLNIAHASGESTPTGLIEEARSTAISLDSTNPMDRRMSMERIPNFPEGSKMQSIPKELWWLVDNFFKKDGFVTPDIFVEDGDPIEVAGIRDCIDCGVDLPPETSPLAIATAILQFITFLRDPLIPISLFPGPDFKPDQTGAYCKHMLSQIDSLRYNTLIYLISVGKECLKRSNAKHNLLTPETLAKPFSRACMRAWAHDTARTHVNAIAHSKTAQKLNEHHEAQQQENPWSSNTSNTDHSNTTAPGLMIEGDAVAEDDIVTLMNTCLGASKAADPGTGWCPDEREERMMVHIFMYLLTAQTRLE